MKKILILLTLLNLNNLITNATDGVLTGNGTDENPFLLEDYLDLVAIAESGLDKVYHLANDIDASPSDTANAGAGFTPIGTYTIHFTGKIHGSGHIIKNLKIYQPAGEDIAFIGNLYGTNAIIDSLGMVDCNITGLDWVGGICANQEQSSLITDCYVTGNVTGFEDVGGITSAQYNSTINFSYSSCNVSGNSGVGGLVGRQYESTMNNCYATGTIKAVESVAGGLIASNYLSSVNNCYYTGTVIGDMNIAGIVGDIYSSTMMNCYVTGSVDANGNSGGLVGVSTDSYISYSYNTGRVSGSSNIGGLVGYDNGSTTATGCYWNTEEYMEGFGLGSSSSCYGLTTAQLKDPALLDSLDFNNFWKIRADITYPGLQSVSNNAPFAFCDSVKVASRISVNWLLKNDYDIETLQEALVLKVRTLNGVGTIDTRNRFTFPGSTPAGIMDTIIYRVGEILSSGDTLWGNTSYAILEKIENTAPVAVSLHFTINMNDTLKVLIPDVIASAIDPDNDLLWLSSLYSPAHGGMGIHCDTLLYYPEEGWIGKDSLRFNISDGEINDSAYLIVSIIEPVSSINNDFADSEIIIYPNPASDGFYINAGNKHSILSVYNIYGCTVLSKQIEEGCYINISDLPDGLYFISVNEYVYKLIKKE